jgi:hypothetical protein
MSKKTLVNFDFVGISSASLCLFHCLLLPLLTSFPIAISHSHWIDWLFLGLSFAMVYKITGGNTPSFVKWHLAVALLVVVLGLAIELIYELETILVPIGSVGLVCGHLLRFFLIKKGANQ